MFKKAIPEHSADQIIRVYSLHFAWGWLREGERHLLPALAGVSRALSPGKGRAPKVACDCW